MKEEKDFTKWHEQKSDLHENKARLNFHERDVWFSSLGANIGFEHDGKGEQFGRPVIVFRKFNNIVFWAIPLTTRTKTGKYYMLVDLGDGVNRMAILSQLRLIDAKRIYQKIGVIDQKTHKELEERIIKFCQGK